MNDKKNQHYFWINQTKTAREHHRVSEFNKIMRQGSWTRSFNLKMPEMELVVFCTENVWNIQIIRALLDAIEHKKKILCLSLGRSYDDGVYEEFFQHFPKAKYHIPTSEEDLFTYVNKIFPESIKLK